MRVLDGRIYDIEDSSGIAEGEMTTCAAVGLKIQPLGVLWMSIVGNKKGLRVLASAVPTITRWILKKSLKRIWALELCFA